MRLDFQEIQTVRTAVETIVGNHSEIRIFVSRLDDSKRGGDLDLLIESDIAVDELTRADLKWSLEEKLALPVDIIFLEKGKKRALFNNSCIQEAESYDDNHLKNWRSAIARNINNSRRPNP